MVISYVCVNDVTCDG